MVKLICGIVDKEFWVHTCLKITLSVDRYLDLFQFDLIPVVKALYTHPEKADLPNNQLYFQQDDIPPHYTVTVRAYQNEMFPNCWIMIRVPIECPVRSPYLSPLNYCLWDHSQSNVHVNKPNNIDHFIRQNSRRNTIHNTDGCQQYTESLFIVLVL